MECGILILPLFAKICVGLWFRKIDDSDVSVMCKKGAGAERTCKQIHAHRRLHALQP